MRTHAPTDPAPAAGLSCDLPVGLVARAVAAVSAGDLESAFGGLVAGLAPWGIAGAELLADRNGELVRVAGDVLPAGTRTIALRAGEIRLEASFAPPAELVDLLRDFFDLALTRQPAGSAPAHLQLVQSGKLAAVGGLAAGVAHEINNPLFAILALTEFLIRDAEPGTKAHDRLTLIYETGLEIKEIVKALLDFARERTDELRPLVVHETVADAVALIRRTSAAKNVEIVERYEDGPASVLGSPNQIKQIVLNLFSNAEQAMGDEGGTVTIAVEPAAHHVIVTVGDTGPGIPADVLPRIFEPFFTTKRDSGGTGLGLAVSHGIAEMHGGELTASSEPGAGATFRLRLPVAREAA